jgi:hypothetical protein
LAVGVLKLAVSFLELAVGFLELLGVCPLHSDHIAQRSAGAKSKAEGGFGCVVPFMVS